MSDPISNPFWRAVAPFPALLRSASRSCPNLYRACPKTDPHDPAQIIERLQDQLRHHESSLATKRRTRRGQNKHFLNSLAEAAKKLIIGLRCPRDPTSLFNPHILPLPSQEVS